MAILLCCSFVAAIAGKSDGEEEPRRNMRLAPSPFVWLSTEEGGLKGCQVRQRGTTKLLSVVRVKAGGVLCSLLSPPSVRFYLALYKALVLSCRTQASKHIHPPLPSYNDAPNLAILLGSTLSRHPFNLCKAIQSHWPLPQGFLSHTINWTVVPDPASTRSSKVMVKCNLRVW